MFDCDKYIRTECIYGEFTELLKTVANQLPNRNL